MNKLNKTTLNKRSACNMASQEEFPNTQNSSSSVPASVSVSLPGGKKLSRNNYHWLLTFHCDEDSEKPFSHYISSLFDDGCVPESWIKGKLIDDRRLENRKMKVLPGIKPYRIFAKIQKGKDIILK